MNETKEARKRVARGARLLDKVVPHWFKLIDIQELSMSSCADCVCGQIGMKAGRRVLALRANENRRPDYSGAVICLLRAARKKGMRPLTQLIRGSNGGVSVEPTSGRRIDPAYYGFEAFGYVDYGDLEAAWKREIEKRLAKSRG